MAIWKLERPSGMVPLVCPRCHLGRLRLHTRYENPSPEKIPACIIETPAFLRCTRSKLCGWWVLVNENAGNPKREG